MVLNNIEILIEKYDNGETTLQEEQQLKHYFAQETVPPHLESYQTMFQYFSVTKEDQFTKDVPLKSKTTMYKWLSVAAVVALMFTVYTQINKPVVFEDLPEEQQLAFNETVKGLKYLGLNLNKGSKNMQAINLMSESLDKGTEQVSHLGEFSKATNKILKQDKK